MPLRVDVCACFVLGLVRDVRLGLPAVGAPFRLVLGRYRVQYASCLLSFSFDGGRLVRDVASRASQRFGDTWLPVNRRRTSPIIDD
jgi:hypothetical protein